ncbi:hypothetical protein vBVpaS1601_10 [Vibrio phage vB_VpaS_1601]|uniref:hypothetical protein n=1 Tax=Vibrio phage SHOU24 TaxID=1414739 RepID=UPI0003ED1AEF|nr:hypothetical protein SHOU24_76 [Vibrio phage SHOU24]AHI61273.1 hypothetical protein SHOU24_76 [Vibrio phage SHOU24]WHM52703.1 hypothetical protein vBVpaP1601_10 [Vibrio phage vB_VpaP_1601]
MKVAIIAFFKAMFEIVVKDLLAGILLQSVKDVVKKFVEKTPWTVIVERFLTRLLVKCLKWLSSLTTNTLWLETANDLINTLQGQGLKEARPIKPNKLNVGPEQEPVEVSQAEHT